LQLKEELSGFAVCMSARAAARPGRRLNGLTDFVIDRNYRGEIAGHSLRKLYLYIVAGDPVLTSFSPHPVMAWCFGPFHS
jgi:hypothetical protein